MWIIVVSVLIGLLRFVVPSHELSWPGTYEAFAHIFVGILLTLCFNKNTRWVALISLIVITLIELFVFLAR